MTELAFVLLFTAAGIVTALLALRLAEDSRPIRWLVWIFCLLALVNLAVHGWQVIAENPGDAARTAAILGVLALLFWAYRRLLRVIRHRAGRRGPGRHGTGHDGR